MKKIDMKKIDGFKTPHWWQTFLFQVNRLDYMETGRKRYGDFFMTRVFSPEPAVFVSNPEAVKELLTTHAKNLKSSNKLSHFRHPVMGDNSVFMLEGNKHDRYRKLLMPLFHGARLKVYGQLIREITKKVIDKLPTDKPFSPLSAAHEIALNLIMDIVFGWSNKERGEKFRQLLRKLQKDVRLIAIMYASFLPSLRKDLGPWSPWGFLINIREQMYELLDAEIQERRQQPDRDRKDILSLLMVARDEDGQPMSDLELRDNLMTLLFAADGTISGPMAWSWYWVHKYPAVCDRLLKEITSLGEFPDPMSIYQLPYLTAVCNEILRLYPPDPVTVTGAKVVTNRFELMGYKFEPGMYICFCINLLHYREDIYPESNKFKPERFIEQKFSPYEYMPFGVGARRCIGNALAQFELKLVLATILSSYQLQLFDNKPPRSFPPGTKVAPLTKMLKKSSHQNSQPNKALVEVR